MRQVNDDDATVAIIVTVHPSGLLDANFDEQEWDGLTTRELKRQLQAFWKLQNACERANDGR